MSNTPATPVRQPAPRLPLVSFVAAVYALVALPLANLLGQWALAAMGPFQGCPPGVDHCVQPQTPASHLLMVLASGAFLLLVPAILTATVGGHIALRRMRQQPTLGRRRRLALWGVILGYAVPILIVAYYAWAIYTGGCCGE